MSTQEINFHLEKWITKYLVNKYDLSLYLTPSGNPIMKERLYIIKYKSNEIKKIINNLEDIQLYEKTIELRRIRH